MAIGHNVSYNIFRQKDVVTTTIDVDKNPLGQRCQPEDLIMCPPEDPITCQHEGPIFPSLTIFA